MTATPMTLLAVAGDGTTVLAAWQVPANGPRDLVGRVAETQGILTDDYRTNDAPDPECIRDPAGFLVLPRDPASPTGQRIAEAFEAGQQVTAANLLARIKQLEEPDGGWPGGDVVQLLTTWFAELGLDVENGGDPA